MVNRAGNEKAQELCLLSSFSPCSVAAPQQAPCLLSAAFLLQKMCGPYTQRPVAQASTRPLPREMLMHVCQTTRAECLSSENTVTVLTCNHVYLFFSFVYLDRSYYHNQGQIISKSFIQAPSYYHPPHSHFQHLLRLRSCPTCFISIVFHLLMNSIRWILMFSPFTNEEAKALTD